MDANNICDQVYKKKSEIVSRHIAGETILVPVMGSIAAMQKIFAVNEVGAFIWSRLNGEKSIGQISEEIAGVFGIGAEQAISEAVEFIDELLKEDLITEIP